MKPFSIGKVSIVPPLILAPMSGVTEIAFRALIRSLNPGDVGLTVSEFVSAEGLIRSNKNTLKIMNAPLTERPFCVQIFGANPQSMAAAAAIAQEAGADIVDINAGCPAPKIVKKGGGAELLRNLPLLGDILKAVKAAVTVPVTLKIRSGWDAESLVALETADLAEQSGLDGLCIHPRTRMQGFRDTADWELTGAVKRRVRIPVVGSGDVWSPEDAIRRFKETGADGIMIGRGSLADPWIFRRIRELDEGKKAFEPSGAERIQLFRQYEQYLAHYGFPRHAILGRLKQMAARTVKGVSGANQARRQLLRSRTREEFSGMLEDFFNSPQTQEGVVRVR